jgi:hypothetical protein
LNANQKPDSFMSLEIALRNSNHIPGGTHQAASRASALIARPHRGGRLWREFPTRRKITSAA